MTEGDEVMRSNWRAGMSAGYPSTQLTLKFIKWLLVTRIYQSHSTRRDGRERVRVRMASRRRRSRRDARR